MNKYFEPLSSTHQPGLLLAAAFSLGIAGAKYTAGSPVLLLVVSIGVFFLAVFGYLLGKSRPRFVSMTTVLVLLAFTWVGASLMRLEQLSIAPNRLRLLYESSIIRPDEPVELIGTLVQPPENAPDRVYLDLEAQQVSTRQRAHSTSGRVWLMLSLADEQARQDYKRLALSYGVNVRALTFLNCANRFRNPGSPDYTEFLDQRGYDLSGALKSPLLLTVLARSEGTPWLARLYEWKQRAEDGIDDLFVGQTAGILKALLLGNRHFIDRNTAETFRAGGTFHILVISGVHVAFLALVILWGLSAITRNRWARFLVPSVILWMYALMVGIDQSPITRATVTATIALAAPLLFRPASVGNTVGLAALVLLVIRPQDLFAPGFQLTFLAVLAIAMLALPIMTRLQAIGQWTPNEATPRPPTAPAWVRWLAEVLYWDQRTFERESQDKPIKYRPDKADLAGVISRWSGIQSTIRGVVISLIVSTAVQICMLPVMILYFHRVTPGGIVLNILVSLLVTVFVALAFATFAAAQFTPALLPPLIGVTDHAARWISDSMLPLLHFQWASFRVAEYTGGASVFYWLYFIPLLYCAYALHQWNPFPMSSSSHVRPQTSRVGLVISGCWLGVVFFIIATHPGGVAERPGWLTVSFLDVGQGDAALIQFPKGSTMLIDSGGRVEFHDDGEAGEVEFIEDTLTIGEAVVSQFLWRRGIERIDYLLPTHAHTDHIQGFSDILKNFSVGRAIVACSPTDDPEFRMFESALKKTGVPLQRIGAGDRFTLDGVTVDVLWPRRFPEQPAQWGNDESVVMRIQYGDRSILLTGDIGQAVEQRLIASGVELQSDILKAPHHGSRTSSSVEFIEAVRPRYAIVSVGERSPFGHPHLEVIDRYRAAGTSILQTGTRGTITVSTDGKQLEVSTLHSNNVATRTENPGSSGEVKSSSTSNVHSNRKAASTRR
jgi:competence protein ComEC